jgi:membrane-bound lytic murein transglycosylase D
VSKVGAAGIWQFMTSTGRAYMKVNDQIDERRSPIKSTIGAARYLAATNRMLYHSWPLTIVAYNHGPGGVRKAVRLAKSDDIGTVIERYESKTFNFASKNYFPEFLAALYAEKYQREIFGRIQQMDRIEFESIRLQKAIRPSKLAKQMQLPLEVILGYNLDLKTSIERDLPVPAGYTLNLPVGYGVKIGQSQANTHAQRIAARSK